MDCKTVRMLVDFGRPHAAELDSVEAGAFHAHLDECPECLSYADQEFQIDEHLGRVMHEVEIPPGLRSRLLDAVRQDRKAIRRLWVFRSAAAVAAAVLLAVGVYFGFRSAEDDRMALGDGSEQFELTPVPAVEDFARPEMIEQWFVGEHGIQVKLPKKLAGQWDFRFLKSKSVTMIDGVAIPTLEFAAENASAKVYLLRRNQWDMNKLPDVGQKAAKTHHLFGKANEEEYVALVVIIEGDEKDFLKPESRLIA